MARGELEMPRWAWTVVLVMLAALVCIAIVPRIVPVLIEHLPIAGEDP
jgi:hypothetical protein